MTVNRVLGAVAVTALAATIWYGATHKRKPTVETPAAPITVPAPAPIPPKPTAHEWGPSGAPPVTKPTPVKKTPGAVYHRVTQGGNRGDSVQCNSVVPYTDGKTPAELKATAKQLGVTQADLAKYFVCVTD